ncbi:MAG: dual specificity protein phosphatase family protein [Planctomycetes bacterium]|nr:dual specificity protein phosphatase family protein [Planctomycetota bacterium]
MREISRGRLWLGTAIDVRAVRALYDVGVEAVVDLAYEEPPAQLPRELWYCRFPLVDGCGNRIELLATALETVAALIRREVPTLVACGAGMSRSPAVLATALARVRQRSPDACLYELTTGKPHDISAPLWADLRKANNQMVGDRPGFFAQEPRP